MNDPRPLPTLVLILLGTIVGIELILYAADTGLIGSLRWRSLAYQNGAFWSGLLGDWQANYAGQSVVMFATYGLLHADLSHVGGNAVTIFLLGPRVYRQLGRSGFCWVIATATLCGALTFFWLHSSPAPMVGASGVVFGLAGALTAGLWVSPQSRARRLLQIGSIILLLVLLNAVIWVALSGLLAWETHLGGFLGGFMTALALGRRKASKS